jgi:hypothetical protein
MIDSNTKVLNNQRIYFDNGAKTYFKSCGTSTLPLLVRNNPASRAGDLVEVAK